MSRRLRFLKAYRTVLFVLGSYLFLGLQRRLFGKAWAREKTDGVHRRNARRIEGTILELKGLFIKVGQMLSIMSNFLPEALTQGLEKLQDSVPPHPYEAIEERFWEEFQKKPGELFADFNREPIASASLGQVHVARLKEGTRVAVKVQYPEIDEIVRTDLTTLKRIFGLLHFFFPAYGLKNVYQEIADVISRELDYIDEGKNLELLKRNFEREKDFLFPDVYWNLSTSKILTLRFMEGIKISNLEELKKNGIDPTAVATKVIHAYCKQVFVDGVYHADPHPGNLLVQIVSEHRPDRIHSVRLSGANDLASADQMGGSGGERDLPLTFKIVLVDFGAMARISERMRGGITLFVEGLIKRDTRVLANAMREMGFVAREDSFEPFEQLVDYFYEKLSNIKVENFRNLDLKQFQKLEDLLELRKIKISFRDLMTSFHVPKDWVLLERTMLLALGLCALLAPQLNPVEIVLPYVEKFVLRDRTFTEVMIALSKQLALSYLQLPHEIHKTLRRLNEGTLTVRPGDLRGHAQRLYVLGHQFLYGFLGAGSLFASAYWRQGGDETYADYSFYSFLFFSILLVGSFIRNRS